MTKKQPPSSVHVLRAVLEKLAQYKLPPSPTNFASVYEEVEKELGLPPKRYCVSDMDLLLNSISAFDGLLISNDWLNAKTSDLKSVIQDNSDESAKSKTIKSILDEILQKKEGIMLEYAQNSTAFKTSIAKLMAEISEVGKTMGGFEGNLSAHQKQLENCYDIKDAQELIQAIAGEVSAMGKRVGSVQDVIKSAEEDLRKSMRKLMSANVALASEVEKANIDHLTGALNRRGLDLALGQLTHYEAVVMVLDMDNFKLLNDTYGHIMGDLALKLLTGIVKKCIRESDIFVRYGGEEFVVILPGATLDRAFAIAERIRSEVEKLEVLHKGQKAKVTLSGGIANLSFVEQMSAQDAFNEAFIKADKLLYEAKNTGKNKVLVSKD